VIKLQALDKSSHSQALLGKTESGLPVAQNFFNSLFLMLQKVVRK
jgi:hypothetical protein